MTETMLTRMARAMYAAESYKERDDMGSDLTWEGIADFQREDRIARAKAGVESLKNISTVLISILMDNEESDDVVGQWISACDAILQGEA